ncbi:MAG: hypothetical protein J6C15_04135 [Bacteroidaceae bacterium]|nr:hypothetical protein [Bacteroidaceae bacterium]
MKFPTRQKHFFIAFGAVVFILLIVKWTCIGAGRLWGGTEIDSKLFVERTYDRRNAIERHAAAVDTLLLRPRNPLVLTNAQGKRIKQRVTSVRSFRTAFPDLNDVQLTTAQRLGIPHIADRDEAARRKDALVYVGDNPFYEVQPLTHSIPYLIPRAATLLTEISRAFIDSLASKGYPFHKLVVTSVLRTQNDIQKLRRVNVNASENSCHQYGTTFDITYNRFVRVQDPDLPKQEPTWGVTLKSILAEVLEDQRQMGTCYVKYEHKQACFHITAR